MSLVVANHPHGAWVDRKWLLVRSDRAAAERLLKILSASLLTGLDESAAYLHDPGFPYPHEPGRAAEDDPECARRRWIHLGKGGLIALCPRGGVVATSRTPSVS